MWVAGQPASWLRPALKCPLTRSRSSVGGVMKTSLALQVGRSEAIGARNLAIATYRGSTWIAVVSVAVPVFSRQVGVANANG